MNGIIILIGILAFIALGICLCKTEDADWNDVIGVFIVIIFGIILIIHIIFWSTGGYRYKMIIEERKIFQKTLNESRDKGRELENAAIIENIIIWNSELAIMKMDNNMWLFDCYTDDRIESVNFIE